MSRVQRVRNESITKFHCSLLQKNNVADIIVAYDKWILRALKKQLVVCLCEKPMIRLCVHLGVNQLSGLRP